MKKYFCALILFSVLLLSVSCKKEKGISPASEKKVVSETKKNLTIGFSIDTLAIERWQRDLDVFMNKAKELGANVIVQNAGNSIEEQNRQLMYLLERNVDVIVVLPKQADSITESVQKIKAKNIPVISYDRLTLNAPVDLYITINSEKVGETMAKGLLRKTKGTNWYYILGPEEDYNMTLIKNGLKNVLRSTDVIVKHIYYTSGWNYDLSYQEMVRLLSLEMIPDAIVCGNDAVAVSVIQAMDLYYPDHHIPICGQDADIASCQNIIAGKQDFTVYKPITRLAEISAEYAVRLGKGEAVSDIIPSYKTINNELADIPVVWLDPVYVDENNMDEIIIQSGFHTESEVYRK